MNILITLSESSTYSDLFNLFKPISKMAGKVFILSGKHNLKINTVEYPNLKIIDGDFSGRGLAGLRKASAMAKDLIRKERIDIVHDFDGVLIYGAAFGRFLKKVKYVVSLNRLAKWSLQHAWESPTWLDAVRQPEIRPKFFNAWREEKLAYFARNIILQSPGLIPRFREGRNIPAEKFGFLPPVVDIDFWRPLPSEQAQEDGFSRRLQLLFVGQASRSHGLFHMLNAVNDLKKRRIGIDLTIMGPIDRRDASAAQAFLRDSDLKACVRFSKPSSHDKVLQAMAESDVFVYQTFDDSCPQSVLWAMACGLPVITSAHPGISILDPQGEIFHTLPFGNALALADSIGGFNESRRQWLDRTAAGRKHVVENLSPMRGSRNYLDFYGKL